MVLALAMADIAIVLVLGRLLAAVAGGLRQPPVIGEIVAGILLGPSVLGLLPGNIPVHLFPTAARPLLSAVAEVGVLLFIGAIGWEFEIRMLRERKATVAAVSVSSVVLPFLLGTGLALVLYSGHSQVSGKAVPRVAFVLFIGATMAATAFPVLARILTERGLIRTRVGTLALASAAIDDALAWLLLAAVSAIASGSRSGGPLLTFGLCLCYVAVMFWLVRPLLAAALRRWPDAPAASLLAAGVLVSSYASTVIGIHPYFGAFVFGFMLPRDAAGAWREQGQRTFSAVSVVLLPVFFIITGLGVNLRRLSGGDLAWLAVIIAVACAGKLIGAMAPAWAFRLSRPEVRALGLLMNTRGLTELIILNAGVSLGVLDTSMFTMMVIMALVTTALAGPLLPHPARLMAVTRPLAADMAETAGASHGT
jgi:Kef-type K+ transport system membrane component KefB